MSDHGRSYSSDTGCNIITSIDIPFVSIGHRGKVMREVTLSFDSKEIWLTKQVAGQRELVQLMDPINWNSITAMDLKYHPLDLHQLVIEAPSRRTRETNGKSEEVFFFVVKFHTKYLHLIEELIKEHKLEYKAKTGISNIIIYPPFCIAYTPRLREALNYGSELSRVFITICFVSAILQWLVECKPAPGTEVLKLRLTDPGETECTTMVGHVYSVMQAIGDYAIGVVVPIALAIYETVDSYVPILKYILVIPAWFILIPFSGVIALFSAIWYCSRFTLMIHALMAAIDELSLLTTNYKMLTSVLGAFVNLAHFIWTVVFKVYLKLFKTNNKAPTKGIKPKTE